jgi:hypothetical protein
MNKRLESILRKPNGFHHHSYVPEVANKFVKGEVGRREFLRTATLLGVSLPAAYSFIGHVTGESAFPQARAQAGKRGGTLRMAMEVQRSGHLRLDAEVQRRALDGRIPDPDRV